MSDAFEQCRAMLEEIYPDIPLNRLKIIAQMYNNDVSQCAQHIASTASITSSSTTSYGSTSTFVPPVDTKRRTNSRPAHEMATIGEEDEDSKQNCRELGGDGSTDLSLEDMGKPTSIFPSAVSDTKILNKKDSDIVIPASWRISSSLESSSILNPNGVPPLEDNADFCARIEKGDYLDVRHSESGKWCEATVVMIIGMKLDRRSIQVEFVKPSSSTSLHAQTEFFSLNREKHRFRLAPFQSKSNAPPDDYIRQYDLGDTVQCFLRHEIYPKWCEGVVTELDKYNVRVDYMMYGLKKQFWVHEGSVDIVLLNKGDGIVIEPKPASSSILDSTTSSALTDSKSNKLVGNGETKIEVDGNSYFVNMFLEVEDYLLHRWQAAIVIGVEAKTKSIRVHFDGSIGDIWDETLDMSLISDQARVRTLGATLAKSDDEKQREKDNKMLEDHLASLSFVVAQMDPDGNCLFRATAHQIYGDDKKHEEVRTAVYDYIEANKDYFSQFIAETFEDYIVKQRGLNEWGDHLEIVAIRELYNKNVQVYDKNGARSLGFTFWTKLPVLRFSYHGNCHYNSVISLDGLGDPLGDGQDAEINIRQMRIEDELKQMKKQKLKDPVEQKKHDDIHAPATATSGLDVDVADADTEDPVNAAVLEDDASTVAIDDAGNASDQLDAEQPAQEEGAEVNPL